MSEARKAGSLDLPLTGDDIARYAGSYTVESESGFHLEIRFGGEDGRLVGSVGSGTTVRLRYQGNDVFLAERDPGSRVTFQVRDGRAVSVEVDFHGSTVLTGRRVPDPGTG